MQCWLWLLEHTAGIYHRSCDVIEDFQAHKTLFLQHRACSMSIHRANNLFVEELIAMGFAKTRSEKAVFHTHNCGVEPAIQWLIEHEDAANIDTPEDFASTSGGTGLSEYETAIGIVNSQPVMGLPSDISHVMQPGGHRTPAMVVGFSVDCKVVLVVVRTLNMSAGKIGAQCAHAAVGLYKVLVANRVPWLSAWEDAGEKTVVLAVNRALDLDQLIEKASKLSLATYMVRDAGRTEVAAGSVTVLAIGGVTDIVDQVTGKLKTY